MTRPTAPIEGVTRCPCGAKYWDGNVCHSCGETFRSSNYDSTGELHD